MKPVVLLNFKGVFKFLMVDLDPLSNLLLFGQLLVNGFHQINVENVSPKLIIKLIETPLCLILNNFRKST